MYNGLDNQIQSLQNQIAQISQLYNNGQTSQPTSAALIRQVHQVQGWRGAQDYSLRPNESELLQDADSNVIFFKACDANGMTKLKALEWNDVTERFTNPAPSIDTSNFVSKEEFSNFKAELSALVTEYIRGDKHESAV